MPMVIRAAWLAKTLVALEAVSRQSSQVNSEPPVTTVSFFSYCMCVSVWCACAYAWLGVHGCIRVCMCAVAPHFPLYSLILLVLAKSSQPACPEEPCILISPALAL